jgi:hypothetical protein
MENVATWCGVPSSTNTCILKIKPGIYDLGSGSLVMQPYVDIEGSGENVTTVINSVSRVVGTGYPPVNGTINGANNSEIRFISINNTSIANGVIGMLNASSSPRMSNIQVRTEFVRPPERFNKQHPITN